MEAHWLRNGIAPEGMLAVQGFVGGRSGRRDGQPVLSLADLVPLAEGQMIDYLDIDVQSAELELLAAPGAVQLLRAHVRRLQVGTHSTQIHNGLKELLIGHGGFLLEHELAYNPNSSSCDYSVKASVQHDSLCVTSTRYGPVYIRDGLLAMTNADPHAWPSHRLPTALW